MRGGIVAAGVILMVLGALLFFGSLGSTGTQGVSFGNVVSTAGFGLVLGFIGFIVFIAGLAASPNMPPPVVVEESGYVRRHSAYPRRHPEDDQGLWAGGDPDDAPRPPYFPPNPPVTAPPPSPYVATPTVATQNPGAGGAVFCPYCGAPSKPEYRFCRSCGKEAPTE
jgi:hypothetical protein